MAGGVTGAGVVSVKARAAAARALGETQVGAASQAGCGARSVSRWEQERDAEYWEAFEDARRSVGSVMWCKAMGVLHRALSSPDERIRVYAARAVLASLGRVRNGSLELRAEASSEGISLRAILTELGEDDGDGEVE